MKLPGSMTREQGKPLEQSHGETVDAAKTIEWFAEEAKHAYGQVIRRVRAIVMQFTILRPVGPVAAFTPWNFPINQVCGALSGGCSIVVKAPEETPGYRRRLCRPLLMPRGTGPG